MKWWCLNWSLKEPRLWEGQGKQIQRPAFRISATHTAFLEGLDLSHETRKGGHRSWAAPGLAKGDLGAGHRPVRGVARRGQGARAIMFSLANTGTGALQRRGSVAGSQSRKWPRS